MSDAPDPGAVVGAVLFTDLVGFTEFTRTEGDKAAVEVLDAQSALVVGALTDSPQARVVKELGDGLMVWFADPHDAIVRAAGLLAATSRARRDDGFPLAVRMGLHHGEMRRRGDDLVGTTVNVAARIADLAGPGELLASEVVVAACGERPPPLVLDAVGPATVKGVDDPVWLVRVTRP